MKVIRHGKQYDTRKPYRVKCDNEQCGCVFEARRKEFRLQEDPRDGDYWHISCPECGHTNTIADMLFDTKRDFTK